MKKGDLIIYPTDTVYGLGSIIDEESVNKIYLAKSRKFSSPLIALLSNKNYIEKVAYIPEENKEKVEKLAKKFWPGALTIILKKRDNVPEIMVSGGETIGVRIPDLKIALDIIDLAGGVLATTSANISGEDSPKSFGELSKKIKEKIDIIVDSGKCKLGEVSTIIDLSKKVPRILRRGAVSVEEIEKIIGEVEV